MQDVLRPSTPALSESDLLARWTALCESSDLDHGYRYEIDQNGDIIVTPPQDAFHDAVSVTVATYLVNQYGPRAWSTPVLTDRGVFVPDVVWMPAKFWPRRRGTGPLRLDGTGAICVEVWSPSNRGPGLDLRLAAYLRAGALTAIAVRQDGTIDMQGQSIPWPLTSDVLSGSEE